MTNRKLRDINDFEWRQVIKVYECNDSVGNENQSIKLSVLEHEFNYQHEFLGNGLSFVMTPVTDRCMLHLIIAIGSHTAGCISGASLTGKSEVTKVSGRIFISKQVSILKFLKLV